jgi:hypothetical protein
MNPTQALETANMIFKDVLGRPSPFTLEEMERFLTQGIHLPTKTACALTGQETYVYDLQPEQLPVSEEGYRAQSRIDNWIKEKQPLNTMEDVFNAWRDVRYMNGDKHIDSQNITQSDSILTSSNVYRSALITSSKSILFSEHNSFSNYLLASRGNNACNFGIRIFDSQYCSSSFEVRWSNKVSRSFFINDCLDLYECLFCYGIRSKKFCIANRQYEEGEYRKIKAMVIDWILEKHIPTF